MLTQGSQCGGEAASVGAAALTQARYSGPLGEGARRRRSAKETDNREGGVSIAADSPPAPRDSHVCTELLASQGFVQLLLGNNDSV